jgi:hypothetical protein
VATTSATVDHLARHWLLMAIATLAGLTSACGGGSGATSTASTPPASKTTATSASSTAAAAPSSTAFTSKTYGYTVELAAGWTAVQAQKAWDRKSALSSDSAEVDQFIGPYNTSSWVFAAPSTQKLTAFTAGMVAATTRDHGDTCPSKPDAKRRVTIGGDPGMLLEYNCGILINLAGVVHHGVGYESGFRDPTVKAASDPADHAAFLAILASMQFPD